jgi:predicted nuclease of predicted toxin-antitoxin system
MRVLLDEQVPIDLAAQLRGHAVETVADRGWAGVKNGELLSQIGRYDVLIAMDRGIEFQQRVSTLPFGIVIVRARSNRMQHLSTLVPAILAAITTARPGRIQRVGS